MTSFDWEVLQGEDMSEVILERSNYRPTYKTLYFYFRGCNDVPKCVMIKNVSLLESITKKKKYQDTAYKEAVEWYAKLEEELKRYETL